MQILCKFIATAKLYSNTRRVKKDGSFPIKIMINHKDNFLIKTEFSGNENEWNQDAYSTKANNCRAKNMQLRNLLSKTENLIFKLENEGRLQSMQTSELKELTENKLSGKTDTLLFVDYLNKFVKLKNRPGIQTLYQSTRRKIEQFDKTATFASITTEWLMRFENWMFHTFAVFGDTIVSVPGYSGKGNGYFLHAQKMF